jgi:lambda family phage portal protein
MMKSIAEIIDGAVELFSPMRGIMRRQTRLALKDIKKRSEIYAAAKSDHLTGNWLPLNSNINDIIKASTPIMRARVQQLVRDFPFFKRASDAIVEYSVGPGIMFQSKVLDRNGDRNKTISRKIEDEFSFWKDEADFSGRMSFDEMMALTKKQDVEAGEFLVIKHFVRDRKQRNPFKIQIIEPDWLADSGIAVDPGNEMFQGVEYSPVTGRIAAYHLVDPNSWGKAMRLPADRVIHNFEVLRPGQLRGVSPFAVGVMVAHDLDDYMGAELDGAKMAAKWLAFIRTLDPSVRQGDLLKKTESGKRIEGLENAVIEYLGFNETVELASNPRPGANFAPFVRLILCILSIATGVPYEILSGDYSTMNYSSGRMVRNDFAHSLRQISGRHIRHYCKPIFNEFLEYSVLSGRLSLPGYMNNPVNYRRAEWIPPGMEPVDPLKEVKARAEEVKAGLRSPQEVVGARGRDLEDVYREIAEAKALQKDYDLDFQQINTALANNPAAIENQKGGGLNEQV